MAAQKEPTHQLIKVADIFPTPDNPRNVRTDSESFKSLLDSIKAGGVRIPLIVRPHPTKTGKFDGRAGARRHAAAKIAKLKEVPCLVYQNMTDEDAFDMTFMENFAREDLTPLEEAHAVATLLEKNAGDVKAVADKFDKSERWIRLRANVHGNLSDRWIDQIENEGWETAHFGIGHFAMIARFDKDTQDHILANVSMEEMTIDELDKACGELLMDMSKATWDKALSTEVSDSEFKRPKCDGCPKRTGHQPLLWEDDMKKGRIDRCLDPACWKDKMAYAMEEKLAAAKEKHENLKLLTTEHGCTENNEIANRMGDLLELSDVSTANKNDKDAFPCFVVRGKQEGKVVWKKKSGILSARSGKGTGPTPLKARRKILASKRWCHILLAIRKVVEDAPLESIQHEDKLLAVMGLVAHIGIKFNDNGYGWSDFAEAVEKGRVYVLGTVWMAVREHLDDEISYNGPITQLPECYIDHAKQIIKLLGLNEDKYWADAVKAIPEPKAWAKLNEKGTPKTVKKPKAKSKTKKVKK